MPNPEGCDSEFVTVWIQDLEEPLEIILQRSSHLFALNRWKSRNQ